jgi:site-specific DNA-cytosine methylase
MIKTLGIHTYFGGFAIGAARNKNVRMLGSVETWGPAVTWSPRLGMNVLTSAQKADYVIANPPCSRFSAMSFSKFEDNMREDLESFPEMLDVLDVANESGAELVHIESGPMLFSKGDKLLEQFGNNLNFSPYVFVLKVSTTHSGLPQHRARTHAFFARRPFPEMDFSGVSGPENVGSFMQQWNAEYAYEPVLVSREPNPVVYSSIQRNTAVFLSTRPKIVSLSDRATPSVVSSRAFAWLEENRWFSVDEMAAVQGYPATDFNYAEPGVTLATALISKSVSPSIAEYLVDRVVVPYFESTSPSPHPAFKVDLT